jgi:hypothetical protein
LPDKRIFLYILNTVVVEEAPEISVDNEKKY